MAPPIGEKRRGGLRPKILALPGEVRSSIEIGLMRLE
jgi:hypothetical protein